MSQITTLPTRCLQTTKAHLTELRRKTYCFLTTTRLCSTTDQLDQEDLGRRRFKKKGYALFFGGHPSDEFELNLHVGVATAVTEQHKEKDCIKLMNRSGILHQSMT